MRRPIITLHLPLEMGAVGAILRAVAREYPDAVVGEPTAGGAMVVHADDGPLTKAQRRALAKERTRG